MSAESGPPERPPRGTLVELVRRILVAVFTAGGWQIARALRADEGQLPMWAVLGSGDRLGNDVRATTNVLQTGAGRMVFARIEDR